MCNAWEKQLVMYIRSAIGIGFFLNNEYRILEEKNFGIGTPLTLGSDTVSIHI